MDLRLLPYTPDRDVYRLLGIPATASSDEISAACRRQSGNPVRVRGSARRIRQRETIHDVARFDELRTSPCRHFGYSR